MASSNYREIAKQTLWTDNPVIRQILGICSALAVTNLVSNTLVMGIGVSLVTGFSSLTVSALRKIMPTRVRMMAQTLIIAFYVILVDIVLRLYPDMSKALGPYVGLIITNCIIMGRCEAFAQMNKPLIPSMMGLCPVWIHSGSYSHSNRPRANGIWNYSGFHSGRLIGHHGP